jgi:hypothetical protein
VFIWAKETEAKNNKQKKATLSFIMVRNFDI